LAGAAVVAADSSTSGQRLQKYMAYLLVLVLLLVLLRRILSLRVLFPHDLVLTDVLSQCTVVVLS